MENNKEYLASVLARLDTMLYRHVGKTNQGKYLKEPAGYTSNLYKIYLERDYSTLLALYEAKKVVLAIEKM